MLQEQSEGWIRLQVQVYDADIFIILALYVYNIGKSHRYNASLIMLYKDIVQGKYRCGTGIVQIQYRYNIDVSRLHSTGIMKVVHAGVISAK